MSKDKLASLADSIAELEEENKKVYSLLIHFSKRTETLEESISNLREELEYEKEHNSKLWIKQHNVLPTILCIVSICYLVYYFFLKE